MAEGGLPRGRKHTITLPFVVLWPSGHMNVICFGVRTLGIGVIFYPLWFPWRRSFFVWSFYMLVAWHSHGIDIQSDQAR